MLNRSGKIFDVVVDGILPGQHDVFVFIPLAVVSLVMGMNGSSIHFVLLAL